MARHFIENMGGKAVVKHLIMAGTPNAGSAVAKAVQYRNYAIPLLALAINTPFSIPAAASILSVLRFSETLTITLAQMDMENDPDKFLVHLNEVGNDPAVPYSIVAGNIQDYYEMGGKFARLMDKVYRLGGQLLYKNAPNDIAVSVESIKTIPTDRQFAPVKIDAACHHLNYFEDAETVRLIDGLMESPTC